MAAAHGGHEDDEDESDPYKTLGIRGDEETCLSITHAEIKKVFRKLALKLHPDKRPVNERERAAVEFERARKACELLSNPSERQKVDEKLRAKRIRKQELERESKRRKQLREKLESREREGEKNRGDEEERERKKRKLAQELEVLRGKYEEGESEEKKSATTNDAPAREAEAEALDLSRALKAAWRKPQNPAKEKDHDAPSLFRAFEKYNAVDVIFREIADAKKRKKKGSAFVICKTREDAVRASEEKDGIECDGGRPQVFVTLAKTRALEEADAKKRKEEDFEKAKEKKVPPPLSPKTGDFEKDVLQRMRKIAEERKKAAAAAAE
jgi:DnaJ family protein C protein 17